MNDVRYKIITDIIVKDDFGSFLVFEMIPNCFKIFDSVSECKRIIEKSIKEETQTILPRRIYLKWSIYRFLENTIDSSLEIQTNKTIYERYIELIDLDDFIKEEQYGN